MYEIFKWFYESKYTLDDIQDAIDEINKPDYAGYDWAIFTVDFLKFIKQQIYEFECE